MGFASLPEQVHRKAIRRGFDFTLMVVGKLMFPFSLSVSLHPSLSPSLPLSLSPSLPPSLTSKVICKSKARTYPGLGEISQRNSIVMKKLTTSKYYGALDLK